MVNNPINVRLSRSDLGRAEQASALRYQLARASGIEDKLIDTSRAGKDADLPGLKAEIAVAKLLGIDFNINDMGIDNGCDLYMRVGAKEIALQVKSTHHSSAEWLLGTPHAKANWDLSVFVRPTTEPEVMQVYGWIGIDKYQAKIQSVDLGHGTHKGVHIQSLNDMESLWRLMMIRQHA